VAGDNATPRRFGDYTLDRLLGRGGMGHVWLARTTGEDAARVCVVKTLLANDDVEYQQRFIDEARLLVLLAHRNICAVFDAGCVDGRYYLAMEHIDGRDLKDLLMQAEARRTPLPLAVTVYVVREVLAALDAAHRTKHPLTGEPLRVVHRDVSPQNVMVAVDGRVKLIDFGLALSTQKVEKTAPQIVMGKLAYMAPEHARGDTLDGRADQFAVGQMLYEMVANERYYEGLGTDALWQMSGVGGFRPAKLRALPPALRGIIERSTAPDRNHRFPDCGAMAEALADFERTGGLDATDPRATLRALVSRFDDHDPPAPAPAPGPGAAGGQRRPLAVIEPGAGIGHEFKETRRGVAGASARGRDAGIGSGGGPDDAVQGIAAAGPFADAPPAGRPPAAFPFTGPATDPVGHPAGGERTRTFRIRAVGNDVVVEGVGSARRPEPTMVVRAAATAGQPPTTPPTAAIAAPPPPRARLAAVVVGVLVAVVAVVVAVVVVGVGVGFRRPPGGSMPVDVDVDAGADRTAGRPDAGAIPTAPVAAGSPVVVDAGVIAAAPVDAGSPVVTDAGADAGPAPGPDVRSAPVAGAQRQPGRRLPPLPTDSLLRQMSQLKQLCSDVPCTARVAALLVPGGPPPESVKKALRSCYAVCQRTPSR
jgi:hypothetical protein